MADDANRKHIYTITAQGMAKPAVFTLLRATDTGTVTFVPVIGSLFRLSAWPSGHSR